MALPNINIGVGAPPLIWSNVQEAFDKINDNFTALDLATGGSGGVDLSFLTTDVSPNTTNTYTLGTNTRAWRNVYTSEFTNVPGSEFNGVWLGTAHIKGISGTVELPTSSTVGGNLIIDPNKTFFKEISVDNLNSVVATTFGSKLELLSGDGIQLNVNSGADSITIENTGVVGITGSTYLTVTETTPGNFTLTNIGVTNVTNTTALPTGRVTGTGIHVDNSTGSIRVTNTGVISIESSSPALTVFTDPATGIVTLTNNAPLKPAFAFVQVSGQTTINAGGFESVLRVAAGYGIKLTTSDPRTLTIGLDRTAGAIDLSASIFGDDSTLLVDGVNSLIPAEVVQGTFTGTVIGNVTGALTGNADTATASTKVSLVASNSTASAHYITFVDAATGDEEVRTDTGLTYNPSTNTLTTSTFVGALTGNADTATTASRATQVTLIATNTAAATHFITFVDAATGDENVRTDTDLTYNPSTNTLTVVNISGTTVTANLVGNSTGFHTGDVKGSVVGDDSTILVDGVDSKVLGRVETTTVRASTFIKTAVYANDTARNLAIPTPEVGMIIFNTTTGKFEGNIDGTVLGWTALN
jgi:hypothetical protein